MNHPCFQASNWYHAITLTERIASLRALQSIAPNVEVNVNLAERRVQRWRSQSPFSVVLPFARRLEMDGINEDEFFHLLGEPVESVRGRLPVSPAWLADLARAFSSPASTEPHPLPEATLSQVRAGFLSLIEPLISQSRDRVHEGILALHQARPELPFDLETVENLLLTSLPGQLMNILSRTLVLELNVARLQGLLSGGTPEERFESFSQRLRQREVALATLQEYPVLARQLMICIENWVAFSLEFLHHLCADWEEIRATFSPDNDPGRLVQIDGGAGDAHRGGRAVLVAKFSSGFQLVYKPRPLAIDVHFQELLAWVNDRGDHPPFGRLKVLDRGTYGWVEFVSAQSCTSTAEVQRFYQRQGGYLALLYALEATDFHHENLIAAGEHPVLLDLEAFFHPRIEGIDFNQADQLAGSTLNYSVLRVGLLPQRIWSNAVSDGIDISGLGGAEGQLLPFNVPQWEGTGTDEMRLTHKQVAMSGSRNRPTVNGQEVDVLDYSEAITTGFTNIYRLLLKHREELLSDSGPLARFAEDEVRVILRPTQTYGTLLFDSYHPDVLRCALDRDRLFDRLWVGVEHLPHLAQVIPAERADLHKGDIPMFTTFPSSRDLWSSADERIADFFDESGLALVHHRMQQLGEDDLAQQLWFIHASLTSLSMGEDQARWPTYRLTEPQTVADRERLLATARAAGDRLEALALRGERDTSWIGLTLTGERHWSLVPLGESLYDGLSGVALFLAYLGAITREARYTTLAQAALTTIRKQVERGQSFITAIGGFTGWGGLIYTFTHLGAVWEQPELWREAEAMVDLLPTLIERDDQLDIIGGAAGCIGSLISLHHCCPSERTLAAAIQCGDRLIANAQPMESGIGWPSKMAGTRPLAGFSHGAAGMAWALLELAVISGEERFRTAALAAIAYERSLFFTEAGNWPDLRGQESSGQAARSGQDNFMTAWCHGAPGIGLARLRSLPHLADAETQAEINIALKTTLAHGFGGNHSLCHGDLGNLELLFQASQTFDDPRWRAEVNRLSAIIIESIHREGWLCGIPSRIESPGLMTGLAGIGYELLRLAEPTRLPSVLVLAPPLLRC